MRGCLSLVLTIALFVSIAAKANASTAVLPQTLQEMIEIVVADMAQMRTRVEWESSKNFTALFSAQKVASIPGSGHTQVTVEYLPQGGVHFRLLFDDVALLKPEALAPDLVAFFTIARTLERNVLFGKTAPVRNILNAPDVGLMAQREIRGPYMIAELLSNLANGSLTAQSRWKTLQIEALKTTTLNPAVSQRLNLSNKLFEESLTQIKSEKQDLDARTRAFLRSQQLSIDQWRKQSQALEAHEANEKKLNDLILDNDRRGVRRLLESYLPWAVMEPSELNAWKLWLEAIENPDPSKATVALRGVSYETDKVQRRQTPHGEIFGFMSTVLTKNQGSYTRRLRSLSTNRLNIGDILDAKGQVTLGESPSVRISTQMMKHSISPQASNFISFSLSPRVIGEFVGTKVEKDSNNQPRDVVNGGYLAVKIDSRRMVPNIFSEVTGEFEVLAPLIIFPDEVVKYHEGLFSRSYTEEMWLAEIFAKTGVDFSEGVDKIQKNSESLKNMFERQGFEFLKEISNVSKGMSQNQCRNLFLN